MIYRLFLLKRQVEDLFIFPFIIIGKLISRFAIKNTTFDMLFIFPFYHTGGAEKVHSLIAHTFKDKKGLILFTRKSIDQRYLADFLSTGHTIIDISSYTDNKFFYWNNLFYRGIIAGLVNRQPNHPIVFNGQSNFGYKVSPWINKANRQIELIHAFSSFSWIRIPFLTFYESAIMISRYAIEEHRLQYKQLGIGDNEFKKINYITNGIHIPHNLVRATKVHQGVKVLYVGRSTAEKRVQLIAAIAKAAKEAQLPVSFSMIGDVKNAIDNSLHPYLHFYGTITNENELYHHYLQHDVVMMTSLHEGFPITIMEAMAAGCTIISTPVGDIPYHVKQETNGFLFSTSTDEQQIINEAIAYFKQLLDQEQLLNKFAKNNQQYAEKEFDLPIFETRYRRLIETTN